MKSCLGFLQLRPILGTTLAWVVLSSATALASAPICAQVFDNAPSSSFDKASYNKVITALARLRIDADLEMLAPLSQRSLKGFSDHAFQEKYAEALVSLRGHKTDSELKAEIRRKIGILRQQSNVKIREEKKSRETERVAIDSIEYRRPYQLTERIPLLKGYELTSDIFEFNPEKSVIIFSTRNKLDTQTVAYSFKNKNFSILTDSRDDSVIKSGTSSNHRYVSHWIRNSENSNELLVMDTSTLQQYRVPLAPSLHVPNKNAVTFQRLTPSGNYAFALVEKTNVIGESQRPLWIDTLTGEYRELTGLGKLGTVNNAYPINDHQIVLHEVISHIPYKVNVYRYDIRTEEKEMIHQDDKAVFIRFDHDGRNLFIRGDSFSQTSKALLVDESPIGTHEMSHFTDGTEIAQIFHLPKSGVLMSSNKNENSLGLNEQGDLIPLDQPLKTADEMTEQGFTLMNVSASPDTKVIILGFEPDSKNKTPAQIEIWTAKKAGAQ